MVNDSSFLSNVIDFFWLDENILNFAEVFPTRAIGVPQPDSHMSMSFIAIYSISGLLESLSFVGYTLEKDLLF